MASPKDEIEKRKADEAHKKRGRQNTAEASAQPLTVTSSQTLGQQERAERKEFQKRVHRKKIHDARETE